MKSNAIKTTGQLREVLAKAAQDVLSGALPIDQAMALHKLSKNISESLYSETKIAMFRNETGAEMLPFGDLPIGDSGAQ